MVGSAEPREQRGALESVRTPACLRERGREEECECSERERDPTYMKAVSHRQFASTLCRHPSFSDSF